MRLDYKDACDSDEGAWVAVTPHGVLPRDSHEISLTIGEGTQVDDFNKGFIRGQFTKHIRRRNGGGSGGPRPPCFKKLFISYPGWRCAGLYKGGPLRSPLKRWHFKHIIVQTGFYCKVLIEWPS